jgi:hypothetical protein
MGPDVEAHGAGNALPLQRRFGAHMKLTRVFLRRIAAIQATRPFSD